MPLRAAYSQAMFTTNDITPVSFDHTRLWLWEFSHCCGDSFLI